MTFDAAAITVTGQIDRTGRLRHADNRLMQLHLALGGEPHGELAVPPLLEMARHAQRIGMRLSRPITTASADRLIDMWCECVPDANGTALQLTRWDERPVPRDLAQFARLANLPPDPHGAHIRTDPLGRIIRFDPPAGYAVAEADALFMLRNLSTLVTPLDGSGDGDADAIDTAVPPALNGQRVMLNADARHWIAAVHAVHDVTGAFSGHHIHLTEAPPQADPHTPIAPPALFEGERLEHLFGSQIGPALRQPIGRIIANAETIGGRLEGPLRADYANYASDIASAGRHLLALVDDLADLEAIEATGFSAAREPVDLADLARRAAGLLALKAADRSIRIDKPAPDETMPAIGEFRRVLQVMLNLLGNAITYAPDGSMIWLRLDDGTDWVSVTVADQGPGLSEEDRQRLFGKWERLGRSGDGGSGLGLYISRRLAHAMDGDLTVESAPGQGARFTLVLPKA